MSQPPAAAPKLARVARGTALLACFRRDGLALLGGSRQDVLASMTPLLALVIVSGLLDLLEGADTRLLAGIPVALSALLLPMVASEALARRWGRGERWMRYIVAVNWCQWAMPFAVVAALVGGHAAALLGLPGELAAGAAMLGVLAYYFCLQWFLARHGLDLTRARAALLVAAVEALTVGLLLLFVVLDGNLGGSNP